MSGLLDEDRRWLDSAVRLARPRLGTTAAYPASAVLIVDPATGHLLGRGLTGEVGRPGAEAAALADARGATEGATAYLTLEPAADAGPYASDAQKLAEAGLGRVVIGMAHPDRALRGRGVGLLRDQGVEVTLADHAGCRELNEAFATRVSRGRPFVTVVLVVSKDGMIGRRDGPPVLLLDPHTERWIAFQRAFVDAVMTSTRALALDAPDFGVPIPGLEERAPRRVLIAGSAPVAPPPGWTGENALVIHASGDDGQPAMPGERLAVEGRNGRPDLRRAMAALAARGIASVQARAGARLTEALVAAELVDRFHLLRTDAEIGRSGLPATPLGGLEGRLKAAGFAAVSEQALDAHRLRTFEPRR